MVTRQSQIGGMALRDWAGWLIVVTVAGGVSAGAALGIPALKPEIARPDPWTGTDARNQRKEIDAEMAQLWEAIQRLDRDGSRGLQSLKQQIEAIIASQTEQARKQEATLAIVTDLRLSLARWEARQDRNQ